MWKGSDNMEKPLTVKELLKLCQEEVAKGNGDCSIMLSNDDEGNGYHYLWYNFSMADEVMSAEDEEFCLDEDIAPKNKTIILG